jgi:hypothetical protein
MKTNERSLAGFIWVFMALTLTLSLTLPVDSGHAAIPRKINYQGYLTDSYGVPVDGTLQMTFGIYSVDAGGTPLWTEAQNVTVMGGVYNVTLGNVTAISLAFDIPYHLGVTIGTDPEMAPRQPLTSVPYAFRAQNADNGGGWIYGGGTISLGTGTDNVGIGTASPTEKLEVAGNFKLGGDLKTDRWLNADSNTFIGVGAAGGGNLSHDSGINGWDNTGVGYHALKSNSTGAWNSAVGSEALQKNTEGFYNTAVGKFALPNNTIGSYNSALGALALDGNESGNSNTAIGVEALKLNQTGSNNTAVGDSAGYENLTGGGNVFIGNSAGRYETGSDRLYIANSSSNPLIYGQFDTGRVCVNCTNPSGALDVNGSVRVRSESSLWISGNGVRPYRQSDSTVIDMNTTGGARITRGATTGNKNVMLPITVTGPFFGQNVTITGLDVYWAGETEFEAISAVLLRRQTGVSISSEYYASLLHGTVDHTCQSSINPTGCILHYDLMTNNVLTVDSGILYLTLELAFSGASTRIDIGGVKLTLRHD